MSMNHKVILTYFIYFIYYMNHKVMLLKDDEDVSSLRTERLKPYVLLGNSLKHFSRTRG